MLGGLMRSKSLFIFLAMSLCVSTVAQADGYDRQRPRPAPRQQIPEPQVPQDYDEYDDEEEVDQEYVVERRRLRPDCTQVQCRPPARREHYCAPGYCEPPAALPYLGPQIRPVPMPRMVSGVCRVTQGPFGWSIVLNGHVVLAHGQPWDMQRMVYLQQQYSISRVCLYYTN